MYTKEQLQFAQEELKAVMEGDKTRYKTISQDQEMLLKMEEAVLIVSLAKTHAYNMARNGLAVEIEDKNKLNAAMLLLQQNLVNLADIGFPKNMSK